MKIEFCKYQGMGNDFIIIDNRNNQYENIDKKIIEQMCRPKFGIGADGLILMENSEISSFKMRYFNKDGKEASMCGNGGRCIAAFATKLNMIPKDVFFEFESIVGIHKAIVNNNNNVVSLKMQDVKECQKVKGSKYLKRGYFVDTGSPHYIVVCDNVKSINVFMEGVRIRRHEKFLKIGGTNVNFMQINKNGSLSVVTYERGVENETLSCGTGAVASAIVAQKIIKSQPEFIVNTEGGTLKVKLKEQLDGTITDIWLEGEAKLVFEGTLRCE